MFPLEEQQGESSGLVTRNSFIGRSELRGKKSSVLFSHSVVSAPCDPMDCSTLGCACYELVFCGATLNIFIHNCFTSQQQIPWLWCHMSLQVRCWRLKVRECLLLAYRGQAHLKKKCLLWIPKTENLYCTLPGRVLSMSLVSHLFNFPHFTSEETEVQGNY